MRPLKDRDSDFLSDSIRSNASIEPGADPSSYARSAYGGLSLKGVESSLRLTFYLSLCGIRFFAVIDVLFRLHS